MMRLVFADAHPSRLAADLLSLARATQRARMEGDSGVSSHTRNARKRETDYLSSAMSKRVCAATKTSAWEAVKKLDEERASAMREMIDMFADIQVQNEMLTGMVRHAAKRVKEAEDLAEKRTCCYICSFPLTELFAPECNHACCSTCYARIDNCPLCRKECCVWRQIYI